MAQGESQLVTVGDATIELVRRGRGRPLLLLPGEEMLEADSAFAAALAERHEVIIVAPPGFGRSTRPHWLTEPRDLAYFCRAVLKELGLGPLPVIGCSLGGWIAAEMAAMDDSVFSHLVLIDPYGVKLGTPTERDLVDIWQIAPLKVAALKWHDAAKGKRDLAALSDEALAAEARNLESFDRFCWEPYLHNPKLKHLLFRIAKPTLFIWGERDGIAPPAYGEKFCALIPSARFAAIAAAGHYPHLEQPEAVLGRVSELIG